MIAAVAPLARGFLELVGPAPVIGHRATFEQTIAPRRLPVGIVDQDDHGLPVHIQPGIVVPALFGGDDAIADEDDRTVLHVDPRDDAVGALHHLRSIRQRDGGLAPGKGHRRDVARGDLHHRHVLRPSTAHTGLQPRRLEPLDDIGDGLVLRRRRRRAALIRVGRQFPIDGLERLDRDRGLSLRRDGCRDQRDQRQADGSDMMHGGPPGGCGIFASVAPVAQQSSCPSRWRADKEPREISRLLRGVRTKPPRPDEKGRPIRPPFSSHPRRSRPARPSVGRAAAISANRIRRPDWVPSSPDRAPRPASARG